MNTREAQAALLSLGYDLGKSGPAGNGVDGDWGKTSRMVCATFQRGRGLAATGVLTPETIKALQAATADKAEPRTVPVLDRAKFFAYLRSGKAPMFGKSLSSGQVKGIEGILDGFGKTGDGRDKTLGYGLATARREVGVGMVPVREGFSKSDAAARAYVAKHYQDKGYSKPAGPWGHVYYGRGYGQLTWFDNYDAEGIAETPDKALDPEFAAGILFKNLVSGGWSGKGKGIAFYLPTGGPDDLMNARRTVNITDHWQEVAEFYRQFMAAIAAARS